MTIKKIKLPSNPYSQLLVHNVASTFSGKRRDRYGVRVFFSVLKIVALPLWPLTLVVCGCGCVVTF